MSWWQFWKWGKGEEKKSGMTYVLGGGNPTRTPALGKPTVTNLVPPLGGGLTPVGMGMNSTAGQGIESVNTTSSEIIESDNLSAADWLSKGNDQLFSGNLQAAIASYDRAIEIKPDYHKAWYNRGLALDDLGRNEDAIASYDRAIEIKPDDDVAWNNRGVALINLGRNEDAIASYDRAVEIKPDLHEAWYGRGNALRDLGRNEDAIASYNLAIKIKPDKHKAWYNRGITLRDLGRNEEAIASYERAIEIKPDKYEAWLNRGVVVGNLSRNYKVALGRQLSYSLQNPAIDQWGYSGTIANYRQGLEFCQQDTHPEGWGKLHWYLGIAHYFQGKKSDRSLFAKAREEYDLALETLTEEAFPETRLEVFQDYVKLLWQLNQPNDVRELLQQASELLQALIAKSPQSKEHLERKFISFQQVTIDLCLQSGDIAQALVLAEQSKATCLSWMIATEPMDWQQIQNLVRADGGAFIYWYYSPLALHTILLLPHQVPHVETTPVDDLDQFLTTWNEQYCDYTGKGKASASLSQRDQRDGDLVPLSQQDEDGDRWLRELPNHLINLAEILSIKEILPILSKHNIQNLTLIPHRDLHRLPLHALGFPPQIKIRYLPTLHLTGGSPLPPFKRGGMDHEVPLLKGDLGGSSRQQRRLLSVEAPNSTDENNNKLAPLYHALIESEYICQQIGAPLQQIGSELATKAAITAALQQGCQIFHFTGHAGYNFHSPIKSSLCLSQQDRLTIADILKIPLDGCQLVCLSACETGITGKQTITDEYVGLVSAFLAQGVSTVVSTLWQVQSTASALVMMEFYRRKTLDRNLDHTRSLQQTTHWLRTATAQELQNWCEARQLENLPRRTIKFLKAEILNLSKLEETDTPYSHPYHWAAYTITGA